MKFLLCGAGGFGALYADHLLQGMGGSELAAVVDPYIDFSSARGAIREAGVPVFASLNDFYAAGLTDIPAAVVAVPIALHAEYALSLLEHGYHLLLEKPVCADKAQFDAIREAARRSGKTVAVGFQWPGDPAMRAFLDDAARGTYGRPVRLRSLVFWPRDTAYYARGTGWAGRRTDPSGRPVRDSVAMNGCAHYLFNMFCIARSNPVSCESRLASANAIDMYDTCAMRYRLENGAELLFIASHATDIRQDPLFIYEFENAIATYGAWGAAASRLIVRDKTGKVLRDYGATEINSFDKLPRFIDAVQNGTRPDCTLDDAYRHLLSIDMAEEEAKIYRFPPVAVRGNAQGVCVPGLAQKLRRCFDDFTVPRDDDDWTDVPHAHATFRYKTKVDLEEAMRQTGTSFPLAEGTRMLSSPIIIGSHTLPNRLAVQPMEGADSLPDSSPSDLTCRRYLHFAAGGAGLIWFESVAVSPDMRSSPHQLALTPDTLPAFSRLLDGMREKALAENGVVPVILLQLNLSGRYSRPYGTPRPRIAYHNPVLEATPLPDDAIVSDDELARFEEMTGDAARLAEAAGFDGVDVKCCHGYLASELLSAYDRAGRYGGSFENRTRFLLNSVRAAKANISDKMILATRFNAMDAFPWPYGSGVRPYEDIVPDFSEAQRLAKELRACGETLLNVTCGNPYRNPHINRPYDHGNYVPDEHPLTGVERLMNAAQAVKSAVPDISVVASGMTYLRGLSPLLAEGMVARGYADIAGFGRMAFAYPDFARDILRDSFDPKRVCLACGSCARLLRAGQPSGCVIRDREKYTLPEELRK